jgi:pimeloyl-ACP methyl ester carboxylesterase
MNLENPVLMGHSMGSGTVMRLTATHRDLARAVILLDPGLTPRPAGANRRRRTPEDLVEWNNTPPDELVAQCRKQTPLWDTVDCQYWALSKRQYHGSYATGSGRRARGRSSAAETLSQITVPVLILKADAPPDARRANEEVVKGMKHVKLVHIDGAGHNLHHDQRQRTIEALKPFLGSL